MGVRTSHPRRGKGNMPLELPNSGFNSSPLVAAGCHFLKYLASSVRVGQTDQILPQDEPKLQILSPMISINFPVFYKLP